MHGRHPTARMLAFHFRRTHDRVLALVDDLSDAQVAWQPMPTGHSIAWNVWHLARWSDVLQAELPAMATSPGDHLGPGRQLWETERLATRWELPAASLGQRETGRLMAATTHLALPDKATLLDYARRAFAATERALAALGDTHMLALNPLEVGGDRPTTLTIADSILTHLTHTNRHLGEIECLRGLQGLRGTATR